MPESTPDRRGQRTDRSRRRRVPAAGGTPPAEPAGAVADGDGHGREWEDTAWLALLTEGELRVEGRILDASNATLYCTVDHQGRTAACVYKPVTGERPLWDFPPGTLAAREVAAFAVSRAAGWDIVPPTVMRDGPFGPGMCQLWIEADGDADLLALARSTGHPQLRDMAVFDAVVNNADRKIGHLLPVPGGRLYGCDHGVCFGEEYKLRTVLWQWRGQSLTGHALAALARLKRELAAGGLRTELSSLLSAGEVRATRDRIDLLLAHRVHPFPPANWPAVPWPPV